MKGGRGKEEEEAGKDCVAGQRRIRWTMDGLERSGGGFFLYDADGG